MEPSLGPASFDAEQHLRLFVEGVRDYAVLMLDADGRVASWNAGARAIKGYEANEIVGRHFSCFYTPEDVAAGRPANCLRRAGEDGRYEESGPRLRKDGSRFWANVVITAIRDAGGALVGFGKITRDISERVEVAEKLRASEGRLQRMVDTVLDTLVDGLIVMDRAGTIAVFNPASERLFGYSAREVIGQNVRLLMPEPERSRHDDYLRLYRETGRRSIIGKPRELVGRRRDGTNFPMKLSVGEANFEGEQMFVGILHDLTAQKLIEESLRQSQKLEAVGQLTGGVAHDFNNILMVITANVEVLRETEGLDAGLAQPLERIAQSAGRAADLTRQLLAFSRKQALKPQPTNLNDLVAATRRLLRRTLGSDIEIDAALDDRLGTTNVDRAQLEAALVNLCLNARDAMPGGGKLLLETRNATLDDDYAAANPDVATGDYVLLAVSDTGIGMPPEVLAKVFEPFFTTKEVGKGTGLGLSMVYGFIKQSEGHIKIYSEVGQGTTIRLYLPRIAERAVQPQPGRQAALPRGNERILIVEDDKQVREVVALQLASLGYTVVAAVDGGEGLRILEKDSGFRLVLTDVVMRGPLSGKDLADRIATRWPAIRVVFMSGYTSEALLHNGRLPDKVRLLAKPFVKAELATVIRDALQDG